MTDASTDAADAPDAPDAPDDPSADPSVRDAATAPPATATAEAGASASADPDSGRFGWIRRAPSRVRHMPIEGWISLAIVGACTALVAHHVGFVVNVSRAWPFLDFSDNLILRDTTPAGGDMGAHVWGPAYLRDELLPRGRLTGWSPDWYAGLPAYHFYMVPPALAIALLSYVIPYGVAFKLVAISGVVTMPAAAWAFGRLTRLPFPTPPLLALGTTLFLFDHSFNIFGGNLASTLAGEFAFSISLSLAIVYLGVVGRGLETGRHRALAAVLLTLCGLTHIIPAFFALAGTAVWFLVRPGVARLRYLATTMPVAGLLSAWWVLPFVWRRGYMNDMGWEKKENYCTLLWDRGIDPESELARSEPCYAPLIPDSLFDFPPLQWMLALAAVGVLLSLVNRRRAGLVLALTALVAAVAVIYTPEGRLWNARLTPFYYLCIYLLAAIGVSEFGRTLASLVAPDVRRPVRAIRWVTAGLATVATFVLLLMPMQMMPGGGVDETGTYRWAFLSTDQRLFTGGWAEWNFVGYEDDRPNARKAWPEYHAIVTTMEALGEDRGCGRAMWEHESQHDRYGTPMALMLLPFWTEGCIGSMEGLYFETSVTTPYHFLNQDKLSAAGSNAQRDLPYSPGAPDEATFDIGVNHLQMFGVRYYMAISEHMQALADGHPDLLLVAESGPWKVYEVADAPLVEAVANRPAVVEGVDVAGEVWLDMAVEWYEDPLAWDVLLAADGPSDWERIEEGDLPVVSPEPAVTVSDVHTDEDRVSFSVDRTGVPVLVKVSYFPNWTVNGAEGPYRVTPNLMVVIPTANDVELVYGFTPVDYLSWFLTFLGAAALILLWRAGTVAMPPPARFWAEAEGGAVATAPGPPPARPAEGDIPGVDPAPTTAMPSTSPAATSTPTVSPEGGDAPSAATDPPGWGPPPGER
ncbi:MAG: hypothetical protein JJU45_14350 [Acidimicrobiia bacterium]|nr:hypothetical protein [Acidimicrobiia bacterium]